MADAEMDTVDRYTCEDVFRRLDDYVDRELTPREIDLVDEHLRICAWCAAEYRFEESVIRSVRAKVQRITAPPDLMSRIAQRLNVLECSGPDSDQT